MRRLTPPKIQKDNIMKKRYWRRRWLCLAVGILTVQWGLNGAQAADQVNAQTAAQAFDATAREISFDLGWRFYRGSSSGAEAPGFNDTGWRKLDLPHDWRIEDLPYATSDDAGATANPSGFAFNPQIPGSPGGVAPQVIGPFDAGADPVPDLDITIPGFGEIVFPGGRSQGYTVAGVGWYRKHFTVADLCHDKDHRDGASDGQHFELRFDGVYQNSDVWLNGQHLGFHPNGYTSFAYDLTPYLNQSGDNVLAVRVDNSGKTSRWYSGSGIYRHTWLTVTQPVRIPLWGVRVTTPVVDQSQSVAHVEVQATNSGAPTAASVRMTVLDSHGRSVATQTTDPQTLNTGATQTYVAELAIAGAALWSPEDPNLYQVRTEILLGRRVVDAMTTRFGIRSLVFNGTVGFLLNGKPYKLHGGNLHHDHGPIGTVAIDRAEERSIEIFKASGFNSVRASHNPRSPYMLDVCDRLGILVWDEFTDMWDIGKLANDYHLYFPQWWQSDLTSMILRDRNHPSVFIWSIGNEISADPNSYGPRLAALVHSLDTTRPVSLGGMNVGPQGPSDPWQYVDVGDLHGGDPVATHAAHPDKAITQSEDTSPVTYADWKLAHDNPWLVGSLVWVGWDYIGESGSGATAVGATEAAASAVGFGAVTGKVPYPWFNDFQGDIDLIGQRKPQNYWRAVVNGFSPLEMMVERPTPPGTQQFLVWYCYYDELPSWTWAVPNGQQMTVHVYTTGDSVTLRLNGKAVGTKTLTDADQRVATFSVPYTAGELTAIASLNGKVIANKTLTTVGAPAAIRLSSDVKWLTTDRGDLAHVLAEVVDSRGRVVPDAVVKVNFQVVGAGDLIGVGNGNPHNVDSFSRPRHYTWHGQALAVLRPAKRPGGLMLTATAPGLQPGRLTLGVAPGRD